MIVKDIGRIGGIEQLEVQLRQNGFRSIAGVDEAGRGPLAGPVVAAAVILPENLHIEDLDDSKKLTPAKRDLVFDRIVSSPALYAIGIVDSEMIDRINILRATLRAMAQAVSKLSDRAEFVLVDGNQTIPGVVLPQIAVIGGDAACPAIAAASIIAKVTRDRIMDHYAALYPLYTFAQHKGYPTPDHLRELRQYGPTPIHRKTFRPVQEAISLLDMQFAR